MATRNTEVSLGGGEDLADITTGSVSPGGTNRFVFGAVVAGGFSGAQDPTVMRYGGSGGTALTQIGSDQDTGVTVTSNIWGAAGSPSGSTTMYADWAGTAQSAVIAALFYTGVNQTTPYNSPASNSGSYEAPSTTGVAAVTVTGCTVGQTVVAKVTAFPTDNNLAAFTAVSGTTIARQQLDNVSGSFFGVALLEKVATGSSVTLEVNVNLTSASGEAFWGAQGVELNNASGGYTLTAEQGSYSLTGQTANLLFGRKLTADQGSYSLTGQTANLAHGNAARTLTAETGLYTLAGSNALVDLAMNAESGSYALNGQTAILTFAPINAYVLIADSGSYALNGQIANLISARKVVAAQGNYNLTGQVAGLYWSGAPIIVTRSRGLHLGLRMGL